MTQAQLAEKAGVALRTVSSLEQGLYEPVLSTFLALADALGVDCLAFTKPDESEGGMPEKQSRGRPPRRKEEQNPQPTRQRGRPRKQP
jgi:transcriptional regulator with XRE-family HTH domain